MNFSKKYTLGLVLAAVVITMFLIVSIFFCNNEYYNTTKFINSFILPPIFVFSTLWALLKLKAKNNNQLSFKNAFTYAYFNQLIGGFLSLGFIVFYMNIISPETQNIFIYQMYDELYQQQVKEIEEVGVVQLPDMTKEESQIQAQNIVDNLKEIRDTQSDRVFSLTNPKLWLLFFGMNFFYALNSVFLSLFLRTKQVEY